MLRTPTGLNISGEIYRYIQLDIERTAVRTGGSWEGNIYYETTGSPSHGESGSFFQDIPEIANEIGARIQVVLDMHALTAGGNDWATSVIDRIRFDLDNGHASGAFLYRLIKVGYYVGDQIAGWTSIWHGASSFVGIADLNFPSGKGAHLAVDDASPADSSRRLWTWDTIGNTASVSIYSLQRPRGSNTQVMAVARASGNSSATATGYNFAIQSGSSGLQLGKWFNGTFTSLATSPYTLAVDDYYWIRFDVADLAAQSVLLRGKVWQGELTDEPEEFNIEFTDGPSSPDQTLSSGKIGLFINLQNHDLDVGYFSVKNLITEDTFRFAIPTDYLDRSIDAIPNISSISFKPATISLGEDLGERSNLTVAFKDHRHILGDEPFEQGTFWGKWRARYGQKLRGRKIRWLNGLEEQPLEDFPIRHFFIDSIDGPTPEGMYTIIGKDLLKFADDERAQAPTLSNGKLAGAANSSATSMTLTPTGIGNLEYPASGYLNLGGKEIVSFTRSGDTLTVTRGQFNTTAISHEANERAQIVLNYAGNDVSEIIQDLLVNYAGVDSAYIPISEWQSETSENLGVIYTRAITEPTPVKDLVSELIEQAALAVWWDELAQVVRLQVLKPISTDSDTFDEEVILQNSLKIKDQPEKRISQIWTYYGQRNPTDRGDDEDNYRNALAEVDLERETDYGTPAFRTVKGQWIGTENAAQRLNQIQISRFRDPPRRFNFDLFPGTNILAGGGYRLKWRQLQDILGNIIDSGAPIQITRVAVEAGVIHIEAEEMLASGVIILTSIILLTTTGSVLNWPVPADWNNDDNSIHCIGGGAGGGSGTGNGGGGGGGGAAYSRIQNLALLGSPIGSPLPSIQYRVGARGLGSSGLAGTNGEDTWFNGATLAASSVGAKGGLGGTTGNVRTSVNGGQAADGVGTLKTSGGIGGKGAPKGDTRAGGGGGGGAGGPNGNGAGGGELFSNNNDAGAGGGAADGGSSDGTYNSSQGSNGGNNRFNFGGGTAASIHGQDGGGGKGGISQSSSTTGNGGPGEHLWTQTIAPIIGAGPGGGGGGGGSHNDPGGNGGNYGGGGGGGGGDNGKKGGDGAQGIIAIVYKPI